MNQKLNLILDMYISDMVEMRGLCFINSVFIYIRIKHTLHGETHGETNWMNSFHLLLT